MDKKKFLMLYLPILFILLTALGYGIYDNQIDSGHLFCWNKDLNFVKQSFKFGKEPIIYCKGDSGTFCFDSDSKEEIECVK